MASGLQSATTLDPTLSVEIDDQGRRLLFTVTPPAYPVGYDQTRVSTPEEASLPRGPVDFVIAIDISGSTAAQAPVVFQDPAASEAKAHLSVLDVVKHAASSICAAMRSQDRVAIVSFSGRADVDLPLTRMEARGKQKALIALDRLQPQDRTNLWEGLKSAMDLLNEPPRKPTDDKPAGQPLRQILPGVSVIPPEKAQVEKNKPQEYRRASIFLFTDATPDTELEPYRGFVVELETYLRNKKRDFTINTFGIGSAVHSSLLHEIASLGGGRFSFVDDASKIGEAVTYAVANEMAVFGSDLGIRLTIGTGGGAIGDVDVVGWPGAAPFSSWTSIAQGATNLRGRASFGPLRYGQSRSFILEFKKDVRHTSLTVSILCRLRDGSEASYPIEVSKNIRPTQEMPAHSTRLAFIRLANGLSDSRASGLARIKNVPPYIVEAIQSLKQEIRARPTSTSSPLDQALLANLDGKISQLLADDTAFRRWGFHYILSLAQAHQLEQCSNSDDPGLQLYGGSEYFRALRAEIAEALETLGPPKASPRKSAIYGGKKGLKTFPEPARPPPAPQPTLTERFIEWYTKPPVTIVCIDGECHIDLADGSTIKLVDLKPGTKVRTSLGASEVVGILKTVVDDGTLELCSVGPRLWITPWHPVRLENQSEWQFPAQIATPERRPCRAVYSLALESNANSDAHSVYVGGVCCVTLGHGVTAEASRDSRSHPFFSDYDAVVRALNAAPAQARTAEGIIQVVGLTRDPITGLANGFQWRIGTH